MSPAAEILAASTLPTSRTLDVGIQKYQCSRCARGFKRQEHLKRHQRVHDDNQRFACSKCPKKFSRSDILSRHLSVHRPVDSLPRNVGVKRACTECARARERCTKAAPCLRCSLRSLVCIYPEEQSVLTNTPSQEAVIETPKTFNRAKSPYSMDLPRPDPEVLDIDPRASRDAELAYSPVEYDNALGFPINWLPLNDDMHLDYTSVPIFTTSPWVPFPDPTFQGELQGLGHVEDVSSVQVQQGYSDQARRPGGVEQQRPPTIPRGWDYSQESAINGVSDRRPEGTYSNLVSSPTGTVSTTSQASVESISATSDGGGLYATSVNGAREPCTIRARRPYRPIVGATPLAAVSSGLSVLGDDADDFAFPGLGIGFDQQNNFGGYTHAIRFETYGMLKAQFEQLCLGDKGGFTPYASAEFPSADHLNLFVQLYFQQARTVLPIYHEGLSDFNDNWLVTLAIAAIGSQYTDTDEFSRCVIPLHEFLRRGLAVELADADSSALTIPVLQALILSQVGMLYYGSGLMLRRARVRSSTLTHALNALSLLSPTHPVNDLACDREGSREIYWKRWLENETWRRLGYFIWLLDAMSEYHFQWRSVLSLGDALADLPHDGLWECRDHNEWFAKIGKIDRNPSLVSAVHQIFVDKQVKLDLGEFGRILLLHGVYREISQAKEYLGRTLANWIPSVQQTAGKRSARGDLSTNSPPSSQTTFSNWRNAALDCVDVLHWAANGTIAQLAGAEHPTVLHLHFSRVVLLTPYDKIVALARSIASSSQNAPGTSSQEETLNAERQIINWAQRDEHKARLAALHCGCLFWHIRRYSHKAFYEPLSVLLATLTLWAYSSYSSKAHPPIRPRVRRYSHPESLDIAQSVSEASRSGSVTQSQSPGTDAPASPFPAVNHSRPPNRHHATYDGPIEPVESSADNPDPTFIRIDRPCDDELVQLFVRSGRPSVMRAYMTGVGDICGPQGPARLLREGRKVLVAVSAAWGRTGEYVALLDAVERATEGVPRGVEGK